jgi:mycothiol synthase
VGATVRTFRPEDAADVRAVMEASLEADAIPGFTRSDIQRAMVRIEPDPEGTVVAIEEGRVVGYCTPHHDDLTVLPAARQRGHGRRLVTAAREMVRRRAGSELQVYVPAHLPGSVAFAEALGFRYRSSLWMFALAEDRTVPPPTFPPEVSVRRWDVARDTDLVAWTAFMRHAFEGHPTTMTWTPAVIAGVHAAPDFDPDGILIVSAADDATEPIAFARVDLTDGEAPGAPPIGDVRLIGVLPAWRGRGLGRELLRCCVTDLRDRGAGRIELSVEAANDRATALYRAHGFEPEIEWPHWVLPVG